MSLKPLLDRVIVKPKKEEEVSSGGILLPDSAKGDTLQGTVVAVGQGYRNNDGSMTPLTLQEGDVVLYNKTSGTGITVEGSELIVLTEAGVIGVLN